MLFAQLGFPPGPQAIRAPVDSDRHGSFAGHSGPVSHCAVGFSEQAELSERCLAGGAVHFHGAVTISVGLFITISVLVGTVIAASCSHKEKDGFVRSATVCG